MAKINVKENRKIMKTENNDRKNVARFIEMGRPIRTIKIIFILLINGNKRTLIKLENK